MPDWNLLLGHAGQNDDDKDATEFWLIEVLQISDLFLCGTKITATCSAGIQSELLNIAFINCSDDEFQMYV